MCPCECYPKHPLKIQHGNLTWWGGVFHGLAANLCHEATEKKVFIKTSNNFDALSTIDVRNDSSGSIAVEWAGSRKLVFRPPPPCEK